MENNDFNWGKWLPIFIAGAVFIVLVLALIWNAFVEWKRGRANLAMWQSNDFFTGSEDDRTIINLRFRNKSWTSPSIVDMLKSLT